MPPTENHTDGPALGAAQQLHDARPWSADEAGLRALLLREPARADALRGMGLSAAAKAALAEATLWFRAALAVRPGSAQAHTDLGVALRQQGLKAEAASHFEQALALEPGNTRWQLITGLSRATQLDEQGRSAEALAAYQDTARQHPDAADAWAALGRMQSFMADHEAATASLQRALQLDPARHDVIELFGDSLRALRRNGEAALVFNHLLQREPDRPLLLGRLMHSKLDAADWTGLDLLNQRIASAFNIGKPAAEPFALLAYCADPALLLRATRQHAAAQVRSLLPAMPAAPASRGGAGAPLRIGYVAGEFRNHAVATLLTPVLEHHDRARFAVFAFDTTGGDGSVLRQRIEAVVHMVPIRGMGLAAALEAVRARQIDILVNLTGFSGAARNDLFAARAARIQVNYLGYPGTMGMLGVDYLIADNTLVRPAEHPHYSEQVVCLPNSYQPNDRLRQVANTPASRSAAGLPAAGFVFCCMNHVFKILPVMFDIWMRLLRAVPNSVLMLYSDNAETQDNLRHEVQARGVEPARLLFGGSLGHAHHLARLRLCDLFLDSWPYNAHTSGSDALWAGLPVLSCTGRTFPSRVGASLLHAVGLPELATESFEAYEAMALRLATEPALLGALRQRLAENLPTAPLFDAARYTRHLEAAYSQMVARVQNGLPPAAFRVEQEA